MKLQGKRQHSTCRPSIRRLHETSGDGGRSARQNTQRHHSVLKIIFCSAGIEHELTVSRTQTRPSPCVRQTSSASKLSRREAATQTNFLLFSSTNQNLLNVLIILLSSFYSFHCFYLLSLLSGFGALVLRSVSPVSPPMPSLNTNKRCRGLECREKCDKQRNLSLRQDGSVRQHFVSTAIAGNRRRILNYESICAPELKWCVCVYRSTVSVLSTVYIN